jgi:Domain of unknown function (DUF5666)
VPSEQIKGGSLNRSTILIAVAATLVLAGCGAAATAAKSSASPSPGPGNAFRNGAAGQLVQINGQTLILTGPNGDTTVTLTTSTTFAKTSVATLADITTGTCVLATGRKDATTGAITATNVRLSPKSPAGCSTAGFGPGGGLGGGQRAGASPRPTPSGQPAAAFVIGQVTAVNGTSVTLLTQSTGSQSITVQAAATITVSAVVSESALQNGQCVRAAGSRDSAGNVLATSITITPAGPSGTCTTGLGGGNRGGGGGFPPAGGSAGG